MTRSHPLVPRNASSAISDRGVSLGRCCAKCKSPYFCANAVCRCHPDEEEA